jgi:hypothetical protein
VAATGGQASYAWSLASGALPPGLSLASGTPNAAISGTPTAAGTYSFTAQVTDGAQVDTQSLSITVASAPALAITTTALAQGRVGVGYSANVTATGGAGPYTWTLASGSLPPGLALSSGTPSATISGTPTRRGTFTFTIRVRDSAGALTTRALSIKINKH